MTMMRNATAGMLLTGTLLGSAFTQAAPITVGVIFGGAATGNAAVSQLNDDSYFDFSAVALNASQADTLAELMSYDVVVIGASGQTNDTGYTAAMFDALRGFMDNGGGVVSTAWINYYADFLSGQILTDADYVIPINLTLGSYNYAGTGSTVTPLASHPIFAGIASYTVSSNHIEYETGVDSGAVALGVVNGNSSNIAVAYQDLNGRSVYLGGQYLAAASYNVTGLRSGAQDRLFEQAVAWAAGGSPANVPEPATLSLLAAALFGLRRNRRTARC